MAPGRKIDVVKLAQLLRSGKSPSDCARYFHVTPGAITKAKKELSIAVIKNVGLETAHLVVREHLDTLAQLRKINENANAILDSLMKLDQGDVGTIPILESQIKKTFGKGKEVNELRYKDPRQLALAAMQEIRGQLTLQLQIFEVLCDVEAIGNFQREVLQAIGEESRETRDRIIRRLKEGNALRATVTIS